MNSTPRGEHAVESELVVENKLRLFRCPTPSVTIHNVVVTDEKTHLEIVKNRAISTIAVTVSHFKFHFASEAFQS